jgi:MFS family permease
MDFRKPLLPVSVQSFIFLLMGNMTDSSYSPMNQFIKNQYLLTSAEIGFITSSIFIGSMIVSLISGYFVDRMGNRTSLRIAFLLMALGSTIVSVGSIYATVLAGYFIIGFGYGIVTPSTNSEVIKHYYPHHANAMGIKQSGVPAGIAVGAGINGGKDIYDGIRTGNNGKVAAGGAEVAGAAALGVGVGLEAAGAAADATVLGAPVGLALNIAGGLLIGGAAIYENRKAIGHFFTNSVPHFFGSVGSGIVNGAEDVGSGIANGAKDAWNTVTSWF